jgi:eukaryotic-like serine/threonine-protein kinase
MKPDVIHDLAQAIADGSAIDWEHVAGETSTAARRNLVEQLRHISEVAEVCRSSGRKEGVPHSNRSPSEPPSTTSVHLDRWGELILIEEVGRGSFGTVYRAQDPRLDRVVAVKLLQRTSSAEDLALRLLHEGRTLARVRHPNVVTVYGAGEHENRVGLCMEFIRGLTLEQMLASHGPFSASEAGLVGHELCGALGAVHQAHLVHRDVKAQNVMREEGGRLVLMDFGGGQELSAVGTGDRRIVGTPLYLAPEILTGEKATISSDIYSLGVLLYHLVSDDYPVKAGNIEDLISAHERRDTQPLQDVRPDLPAAFVRIVERATDRVPTKRFGTVGGFATALARYLGAERKSVVSPRLRMLQSGDSRSRPADAGTNSPPPSVAVLPFIDMSPAKDQEWFCDGLAEELINGLTQVPGLSVAARTSTFRFKGHAQDIRKIGNALNVATVLDGSVRRNADRLRITVELINTSDGYHLWSRRFDRSEADVFAVQDEIATAVIRALSGKLAAKKPDVPASRSTDLESYSAYLEGRYHWNHRTEDELKKSVACFERVIGRDANYAPAYAGLADAYVTLGTYGALPPGDVMPRALWALERSLEIDARLAEAYACRGCIRSVHDFAWSDAERDFLQAIEMQPSYPTAHHWYAINHLVPRGRFEEATVELRRALELDPLALAIRTSIGMKSYFSAQYDDAVRELAKTIDLDPGFGMAHLFLGATYTEQAKYVEALEELRVARSLVGRSPEVFSALAYLHGLSGNLKDARDARDELMGLARERYVSPVRIAQAHVGLGEHDKALDRLEEAYSERAADLAWLNVRPAFVSLRAAPRFAALSKRILRSES